MALRIFTKTFLRTSSKRSQPILKLYSGCVDDRNKNSDRKCPPNYEYVIVEKCGSKANVGVITFNRLKALNILCNGLMLEVGEVLDQMEEDCAVGAVVITGSEKVFAAGGDLKELVRVTYMEAIKQDLLGTWSKVSMCKKPIIAAVNGFALGGGCILAMMCDIIYAGDSAKFSLPEVLIGTIPGGGGTQRLTRLIGKSKAMEYILTGSQITAEDAEKMGLVSKIFPSDQLLEETIKMAEKIANNSGIIVSMAKEAVNVAYESTLREGLYFEKRMFHGTFAVPDRKEGFQAFIEKRPPEFKN